MIARHRTLGSLVYPLFVGQVVALATFASVGVVGGVRTFESRTVIVGLHREAVLIATLLQGAASESEVAALVEQIRTTNAVSLAIARATGPPLVATDPSMIAAVDRVRARAWHGGVAESAPSRERAATVGRRIATAALGRVVLVVARDPQRLRATRRVVVWWPAAIVLGALMSVAWVGSRLVSAIRNPTALLQEATARFAAGDLRYRCAIHEPLEFARLAATLNAMAAQLSERIDAVSEQRNQISAILRSMNEGLILVDERNQVQMMNDAARELFHVTTPRSDDSERHTLLEVVRNTEIDHFVARVRCGQDPLRTRTTIYRSNKRYLQLSGTTLEVAGGRAVLVVLSDITRIEELECMRRDFVANVSHELKTPLTSILGYVETLLDDRADTNSADARRFLGKIVGHTQHLHALVEDLLQLSRLEQQETGPETATVHIQDVVANVRDMVGRKAEEKRIALLAEYRGSTRIQADPRLLEQAITNLVENAIKYCPDGSRIEFVSEQDKTHVRLTVQDNGPGIREEERLRVFERFYRVDRAQSRGLGGTGLGLAIVKHIAQAHGGAVYLEASESGGCTFTIELPQPG